MQQPLSPNLLKALEELKKSFSHKSEENLQNLAIINEQELKLNTIQQEVDYKNSRIQALEDEIMRIKNEAIRSLKSKVSSTNLQEKETVSGKERQKSLLEIHLQDTKYCSDKWEHYFQQYEGELNCYRNMSNIRLLEIGVQNGGSLECWFKYFGRDSEIVGIDIDTKTSFLEYEESIKNYVGDATDPSWLKIFCEKESDFDIIIDDGSHINDDIIKTFVLLYEKIKPGGVYIAEDLHACYWKSHNGGVPSDTTITSAMSFFKEIIDNINSEHWINLCKYNISNEMPLLSEQIAKNDHLRVLLSSIESIKFTNSMVFIRKSQSSLSELGKRIVARKEAVVDSEPLDLPE